MKPENEETITKAAQIQIENENEEQAYNIFGCSLVIFLVGFVTIFIDITHILYGIFIIWISMFLWNMFKI